MKRLLLGLIAAALAHAQYFPSGSGGGGGASGQLSVASATYAAGTTFLPPGGGAPANATEANVQVAAPVAGTWGTGFSVSLTVPPGAGNSLAFTWRKNGVSQSTTCTISNTSKSCSDTTHTFQVAQGDLMALQLVATGTPAATAIAALWATPGVAGANGSPGSQGPAGPSGVINQIQNNAVNVTQRPKLNFVNGGCVDNAGNNSTDCTATGGATPGGTAGQIQYNNTGALGGFTASGDATINTGTGAVTLTNVNGVFGTCGDSTHVCQVITNAKGLTTSQSAVAITAGTGNAAAVVTLAFSATPTFTCPSATAGTVVDFQAAANAPITLTANITSSTLATCTAGTLLNFLLKQDATGGRTVVMPTGFDSAVVHPAANVTTKLTYYYDGANGRLISSTSDAGYSAGNEGTAPGANPPAGVGYTNLDSTAHTATYLNNAGNRHIMPKCAGTADTCASTDLSDGANLVSAASAATAAKQVCTASGASKTCSYIDFPEVLNIPAANCNNATAGAGWSIGAGGTVTCRAGTNNKGGFISITDTSTTFATFQIAIPEDWDTASNPFIRFQIASTDTTTGHTIIPSIQVACYKGDGSTTDDVAANAAHSLSTVTLNTTANQFWSTANVQMNATDVTGCVAGAIMQVTVGRATDTATNAEFYSATVTFPRLLTVQAN